MGKLLLAHLQRTPVEPELEDIVSEDSWTPKPVVKNTFLHFNVGDRGDDTPGATGLPRSKTAPSSQAAKVDSLPAVDSDSAGFAPANDGNTPAAETEPKPSSPAADANKDTPQATEKADDGVSKVATWLADGRRLKGRDTRLTSTLRVLLEGGPACAELVVTILPLMMSSKRGGANFKAANGVGTIQMKCNNPIDKELNVCLTVGGKATRCQRHNFVGNNLMTFRGEWDFKAFIDSNADRPLVAVSLQLLSPEEGNEAAASVAAATASASVAPALSDPAIAAFSLSTMSHGDSSANNPVLPTGRSALTPQATPGATPRTPQQAKRSPASSDAGSHVPPSPSAFFTMGQTVLFCFTMRRADGVELGLEIERINGELLVNRVVPGGAAEAWNRQCFQGPFSQKAVVPGDRIIAINGRADVEGMLEEVRYNQLLKLYVVRGDLPHSEIPLGWCGAGAVIPAPAVQFVPVPVPCAVLFSMPCAKHAIVDGNTMAICPEQLGAGVGNFYAKAPAAFSAGVVDYIPPGTEQDICTGAADTNSTIDTDDEYW